MAFLISLGVGACLLGMAVLARTLIAWRQGRGLENWPAVKGMVSEILSLPAVGSEGAEPVVAFVYDVDGHRYSGTGVLPSSAAANGYQVGDSIEVFYNPTLPQQGHLQRPARSQRWMPLGFGATLVLLGGVIAAWGIWG